MIDPTLSRLASRADYLEAGEETDLIRRAQAGDQTSRDRLVLTHMRLALAVAKRFRHYGIPVDDLVHEGVAGLLATIDVFDVALGFRFATYAQWWVRSRIGDYVVKHSRIVSPGTTPLAKTLFFKLRTARAKVERDGALTPSQVDTKLAVMFGCSVEQVRNMSAHLSPSGTVSLNEPVGVNGAERGELLVDDHDGQDVATEQEIDGQFRRNGIKIALARLNDRERAIVMARHLGDDESETLEALGQRFGISRERVRQIEARALEKLKGLLNRDGTAAGVDRGVMVSPERANEMVQ